MLVTNNKIHRIDYKLEESNKYGIHHGSSQFPLAIYEISKDCDKGDFIVNIHWHNEYELLLVTNGRFKAIVDNETYFLKTGEAIFIHSHQVHSFLADCDSTCSYESIVFDISLLSGLKYHTDQSSFILPLISEELILPTVFTDKKQSESLISDYIKTIIRLYKQDKNANILEIKAYLYLLFSLLFKYADSPSKISPKQRRNTELIKNVLIYIEENLDKPLTTQILSKNLYLSSEHFCRLFKRATGRTPVDYINNLKMNKAAELLQFEDKKVIEIAFMLGFNNLSHFNRLFKRYMKKLPKEYKP